MAAIGAFTEGVARHADTAALEQNADGVVTSCSELYQLVVADATSQVVPSSVSGLPAKNEAHPIYTGLYVEGYAWRHLGIGSKAWECTVKYKRSTSRAGASSGDPSTRILLMEWGFSGGSGDLVADATTGRPVKNAAGDPFDSVPQRDEVYPCVRYGYKEKNFNPARIWLNNCINQSAVTVLGVTFPPHTCRLKVECRKNLDADDFPYEWTYTFEGRDCWVESAQLIDIAGGAPQTVYETDGDKSNIGWDLAIAECGFNYILNGEKVKFTIPDDQNNQVEPSLPQFLDTSGAPLSPTADPIFRVVRAYKEADLSGIAPTTA
jgi:hypothetical protein